MFKTNLTDIFLLKPEIRQKKSTIFDKFVYVFFFIQIQDEFSKS